MARSKGQQNGSVTLRGRAWRGAFRECRTDVPGGMKWHTVTLGLVSDMTKLEARAKLREIVRKHDGTAPYQGKLTAPDLANYKLLIPPHVSRAGRVTAASRGAVAELLVAADLQARGFDVFMPVSPIAACDMVAITSEGLILRVQVKKAATSETGRIRCDVRKDIGRFDLLAVLVDNARIDYIKACDVADAVYPEEGVEVLTQTIGIEPEVRCG